MMHHRVKTVKERVMSFGLCGMLSLSAVSLHAMDNENLSKSESENTAGNMTNGWEWLTNLTERFSREKSKPAANPQVSAIPAVQEQLPEAAQNLSASAELTQNDVIVPAVVEEVNGVPATQVPQGEAESKIVRSELKIVNDNAIESSQIQNNTGAVNSTLKQSQDTSSISSGTPSGNGLQQPVVSESFLNNITFQGLAQNEKVLYGVGAVGVLTVGTICYVLYKKGVFKKLCVSMKKHPWCTAAITGVAALSAAAGALYLSGADKEAVINFMNGIKVQMQNLPGKIKNSLPAVGVQAKAA